jgi:mannose-6-phosphate isomerase-like protein (cupin superfamily)
LDTDNQYYEFAGHLYRILKVRNSSNGSFALIEGIIPAGDPGPPLHTHSREDEDFYILEGDFTFLVGDRQIEAVPGDFIQGPRGVKHTFRNNSKNNSRILVVVSPSGFEKFITELGVPAGKDPETPEPPSPQHIEKLIKKAPQYGITMHL